MLDLELLPDLSWRGWVSPAPGPGPCRAAGPGGRGAAGAAPGGGDAAGLAAMDDRASARLLVLAGLGEGRACARTVRALVLLFGLALHPTLPAGPVPAAVAGGWVGLLRQVRSRGVLVLRQEPAAAEAAWWLAGWVGRRRRRPSAGAGPGRGFADRGAGALPAAGVRGAAGHGVATRVAPAGAGPAGADRPAAGGVGQLPARAAPPGRPGAPNTAGAAGTGPGGAAWLLHRPPGGSRSRASRARSSGERASVKPRAAVRSFSSVPSRSNTDVTGRPCRLSDVRSVITAATLVPVSPQTTRLTPTYRLGGRGRGRYASPTGSGSPDWLSRCRPVLDFRGSREALCRRVGPGLRARS